MLTTTKCRLLTICTNNWSTIAKSAHSRYRLILQFKFGRAQCKVDEGHTLVHVPALAEILVTPLLQGLPWADR